jgi:glutathione reductase (NADPH)
MQGCGIRAEDARIEWSELMRFKRSFTDPVPKSREQRLAKAGIAAFHGSARFVGPTSVEVGGQTMEGRRVVIATGAKPRNLCIPGKEHVKSSDHFLELERLPRRIVFIGGGYISFEFAHVATRAGSEVTILHRGEQPLAGFDPDLVKRLVRRTTALGARVEVDAKVETVQESAGKLSVHASTGSGLKVFDADLVVHGAGRVADIDDLNLIAAGVQADEHGVQVNEYLQSTVNPAVYAAGDAAASGGLPLTPIAGYEGQIVASNLLKGNHRKVEHLAVPTVVFTIPPLAAVGLSEKVARQKGLQFRIHQEDTSSWYSSRRVSEDCSGFKVLIEDGRDRILGAHVLGPHADELINIFALAMQADIPATRLKHALFGYPTVGSDVKYML